ncbi:acyltransferase, partial [Bacteroides salyersiae]
NIYLAFFIAFMLTIVISALSWRFIEKPIIEKRYFTSSR